MTQSNGKGISGIVRLRFLLEVQQVPHHDLDLGLLCPTIAHNRLLDFQGLIFEKRNFELACGQQNHSSSLPQFQCALGVDSVKDIFNRYHFRCVALQYTAQLCVNSC